MMRNLLGRLNARSPEELSRIAAAWQVPVSGGDRLGQVAQLYRALSDPRAVRDMWSRLPEDEQALIARLALGQETARSLDDLAADLDRPAADVRQTAIGLYHKGIIAREGDDDPLPVGEAPRLFLPRELAQIFQRVQDEIEAGDISSTPLRTLLSLLDDREIEEAAEAWGVRVIPGLRTRDELIRRLLQHIGDPRRLAIVEGRLKRDAGRVWQMIQATSTALVPLSEISIAAGLNLDDPRQAQRLRQALTELEEALLVWHTYLPDGSRRLFVPLEIRSPGAYPVEESSLPTPAANLDIDVPARHRHAVAWDLLTLLRALSPPQDQRIDDMRDAPRGWLRRLNDGLWNRGADIPAPEYLDFLIDLARVEGLLTGGDPAVEEPFQVSPVVRAWRDRSFRDQTDRLRGTWLGSSTWIEGAEREDVEVWGADWPGFRFKFLTHLALLDPGTYYDLDAIATWAAERDPEMLGSTFEIATARNIEVVSDEAASRRAAVAEVVRATLETAFAWFGLVENAAPPRKPRVTRLTETGSALVRAQPPPDDIAPGKDPAIHVAPSGEIRLMEPAPLRVWSLTAFADIVELAAESRYRITERSVGRALRAGFEIRHVESFLANQSGAPLPGPLTELIQSWSSGVRRVRATRMIRLTPDDPAQVAALQTMLESVGISAVRIEQEVYVPIEDHDDLTSQEAQLLTHLREAGFTAQGLAPNRARSPEPRNRAR